MQASERGKTEQWLDVSAQVLHEKPEQLQYRLLQISRNCPELSCYATELAQLRMIGPVMEQRLLQIWDATSTTSIDKIVRQASYDRQTDRVLHFLATLVKIDIDKEKKTTIH